MAADTAAAMQAGEVQPCPDPSAHEKSNQLSSAASTAALYATHPERNTSNPLGADGKLSSRGAATSLKYAQAHELPSFPSRGGELNAANTAAMLAKDHKMKDPWQPEASLAGSKAAVMAHRDGGKLDLWQPSSSSAGNSAATLAMRNKGLSPQIDRGHTEAGRTNSLLAAAKSHKMGRQRAGSMPAPAPPKYPDAHNSGKNALSAAAVSHRASVKAAPDGWSSEANQAARLKNAHMDRSLFTDDPHIQLQGEAEEQRHQAALHASAASYARGLYAAQKRGEVDEETSSLHDDTAGAQAAHRRNTSTTSQTDIREEAIRYIHLQDAAHRLAQERLAKVDKDMEPGRYREYYGYPNKSPRKSRLSIRSGGRKRASSEGQWSDDSDDEFQARRIRAQMSQLSTGIDNVSDKQRQDDRARLLAAAEKRVHAQMHSIDEKVFLETGKPSQAMMDEWEAKAREKAERDRETRETRERVPGKTHIGGGKYMDDAEIEAIAAARLKPTLDQLNDTAEKKRARDEELRIQRDQQETARMEEKIKDQQTKAEFKRIKEQDKAAAKREKEERKAAQQAEKDGAKARKSEDKRKSREQKREDVTAVAGGAALAGAADKVQDDNEGVTRDEPADREVVVPTAQKEKPQEKPSRGIFDRIANRLKRHGDERKTSEEEKAASEEEAEADEEHNDGAAVAGVAVLGAGAAAATGLAEEHVEEKDIAKADDEAGEFDDRASVPAVTAVGTEAAAAGGVDEDEEKRTEVPATHSGTFLNYRDGAVPAVTTSVSTAAAPEARDVEEDRAREREIDDSSDLSDDENEAADGESNAGNAAAATAGIAALGGIIAAGALEAERRRKQQDEEPVEDLDEVSSLSTSDDEEVAARPELYPVASTEHTGQYTFAGPATGLAARPDLERHISTIQDSSSEADDESDDLEDSSNDEAFLGQAPPSRPLEEPVPAVVYTSRSEEREEMVEELESAHVEKSEETPDRDRGFVISPTPAPRQGEGETVTQEPESAREASAPVSLVTQLPRDEQGNIVIVKDDAEPDSPHLLVTDAAPAPAIKTGPREAERRDEPQQSDKERKGIRGFFSKLKGKSKADNKLHKEPPKESTQRQNTTAPAKAESNQDDIITPVTTTSAGLQAEGHAPQQHIGTDGPIGDVNKVGSYVDKTTREQPLTSAHIGTDGPIGDSKHISGVGSDPRSASPSSFKRYDDELRDLDDVSSSGVDEDDYARGRGGRLAKRLGISRGKGKDKTTDGEEGKGGNLEREATKETSTSGDGDQFEEARDHFDESLAPPPAFAGQAKSESPVRGTRFQEQL